MDQNHASKRTVLGSLQEYDRVKEEEISGDTNRYYTVEALRSKGIFREPTDDELFAHWSDNGGAKSFQDRYCVRAEVLWPASRTTLQPSFN